MKNINITAESWVGRRSGKIVAAYPDRYAADSALYAHRVETVSPLAQPGATPERIAECVANAIAALAENDELSYEQVYNHPVFGALSPIARDVIARNQGAV